MNRPNDMRKILNEAFGASPTEPLEEKGGIIDKALSKVGTTASKERAKNRVNKSEDAKKFKEAGFKAFVNVIKGDWKNATYANTAIWLKKVNVPDSVIKSAYTELAQKTGGDEGKRMMLGLQNGLAGRKDSQRGKGYDDTLGDNTSSKEQVSPKDANKIVKGLFKDAALELGLDNPRKLTVSQLGKFLINFKNVDKNEYINTVKATNDTVEGQDLAFRAFGGNIGKVRDVISSLVPEMFEVNESEELNELFDKKKENTFTKGEIKTLFKLVHTGLKDHEDDVEDSMTSDDNEELVGDDSDW